MRKFLFGFATTVIIVFLGSLCYVRFGFMDPRADIEMSTIESAIAMPSLDAAVNRRAPTITNPIEPTDGNLTAGMKIYQAKCASCHGDIRRPRGILADAFYPRAPQFVEDSPDMPGNQNFYIIQHGIRLSGMPAWKQVLNEQEIWQVTAFLSHMERLPSEVSDAWKSTAGSTSGKELSPEAPKANKTMDMPMR